MAVAVGVGCEGLGEGVFVAVNVCDAVTEGLGLVNVGAVFESVVDEEGEMVGVREVVGLGVGVGVRTADAVVVGVGVK